MLERIRSVQDVQCTRALLLCSAANSSNYQLRVVRLVLTEGFVRGHDEVCGGVCVATLPLALGGLGLRSALRSRQSVYWASWADTLPIVRARHPPTAVSLVEFLTAGVGPVSLMSTEVARRDLLGVWWGSHFRHGWIWRMVHAHLHLLRSSPMGGGQVAT